MDGIVETQAIGYYLSPQQSLAWLAQQRAGRQFLTQMAVLIERKVDGRKPDGGTLDAAELQRALGELVSRHEVLRTAFRRRAGMKIPFQVIVDEMTPAWETTAAPFAEPVAAAEALLAGQAKLLFDLEQGPLVRALLCEISDDRNILVLTVPAVCADSASMSALVQELFGVYGDGSAKPAARPADEPAPEPIDEPLRYVQFAQWQSELLEQSGDEAADDTAIAGKKFWLQRAESGEQQVELPGESAAESPGRADAVSVPLSAASERQIQSLAAAANGTSREVLLAAWQSLLSRLTGRARLAVGVALDGREYAELAGAVGLIAKMVPIHARFEGNPTFLEAVGQAKAAIEEAAGVQEYFDPAGGFSGDAAIAFSYNAAPAPMDAAGLRVSTLAQQSEIAPSKLRLSCVDAQGTLELQLEFDSARYERTYVEQLAKHFMTLLTAGVENPKQQVARLALLNEAETARQVYEWNATDAPYPAQTMHSLIEEQARRTPDRMAVRCEDRALSYAELNRRANRLAHHLRGLGVRAGSLVGLCVMRSEQMIVAVLAIHKAGGAYVPLSADYPPARLAQQLEGAAALITEKELKAKMPERWGEAAAGPVLCLDGDAENWADAPETDLEASAALDDQGDDLAYVIYTSGSTGQPKGVGVRHRNLVNYASAIAQRLKLSDYPDGLQFATVSTLLADLGNTCIYPALLSGGGVHVIPYEVSTDAAQMAAYQAKYPIDVLKIVPSHLAALLASPDRAKILPCRYLITGGEALTWSLVAEIEAGIEAGGAGCELINHYGPTETTVGSLMQPVKELDRARAPKLTVPIGRPIANTQAYVLDSLLQPVPEGVTGELYISGAGVSAGYVGQPKLTEERFIPNPFVAGETKYRAMYRTGDLVRFVPGTSGAIEFLGRADDQVKVRGFRIELGEIEAALGKQPGVRQAVVLAREDAGGTDKHLVGYVVASAGEQVTGEQLRRKLRELLPGYMVPNAVILLEKLPLTANGKIDRKALPDADAASFERPYIAPATPTEQAIAAIWQEVLHRPQVSSDANFFELGGHSLTATQVISRIRQQFSVGIAMRALFESPVLRALAAAVDAAGPVSTTAAAPIKRAARDAYRVTTG